MKHKPCYFPFYYRGPIKWVKVAALYPMNGCTSGQSSKPFKRVKFLKLFEEGDHFEEVIDPFIFY